MFLFKNQKHLQADSPLSLIMLCFQPKKNNSPCHHPSTPLGCWVSFTHSLSTLDLFPIPLGDSFQGRRQLRLHRCGSHDGCTEPGKDASTAAEEREAGRCHKGRQCQQQKPRASGSFSHDLEMDILLEGNFGKGSGFEENT